MQRTRRGVRGDIISVMTPSPDEIQTQIDILDHEKSRENSLWVTFGIAMLGVAEHAIIFLKESSHMVPQDILLVGALLYFLYEAGRHTGHIERLKLKNIQSS